jgi:hypothetical protein
MKTKITITVIALFYFILSPYAQTVSNELSNKAYWSTNKKGTITAESGTYTLTQTEPKKFLMIHNYEVDFTKPFEIMMDLKILEGSSFYIGLNADTNLVNQVKIGILTYQIYIDHWRENRMNEVKLLKKNFPKTMNPRSGVGLKISVIEGRMLIEMKDEKTGMVINYKTKPFKINPKFKNFTLSNYGNSTMTKVEISNFAFNYL